jgi:hypothetical protein
MSRKISVFSLLFTVIFFDLTGQGRVPRMMFGDTSRTGSPFSKDPHVISFGGRYLMYYSIQPYRNKNIPVQGWGIGIAESNNLIKWNKKGPYIKNK